VTNRILAWIDRRDIEFATMALRTLALFNRRESEADKDGEERDWNLVELARKYERSAECLENIREWVPDSETDDEQLAAIEKLVREYKDHASVYYSYNRTMAADIRSLIKSFDNEKKQARAAFASLVEEQRTNRRAMQFMVKAILNGGTHRIKNARTYVLIDAIDTMVHSLMNLDVDNAYRYESTPFGNESWDFRRLAAENAELNARLNEALEEIERINGLLPVDDAKVEDNIQF